MIALSLDFHLNHYFYNESKEGIATLPCVASNDDWKDVIPTDSLDDCIQELKKRSLKIDSQKILAQL